MSNFILEQDLNEGGQVFIILVAMSQCQIKVFSNASIKKGEEILKKY